MSHQLRPDSFYQVNLPLNEILISEVLRQVQAAEPHMFLTFFSGVGNFAFPIAKLGLPVTAIESANSSFYDARDSQKRTGLSVTLKNTKICDNLRLARSLPMWSSSTHTCAGAAGLLPKLLLTRPKRILYVACHAPSLARDMRAQMENTNSPSSRSLSSSRGHLMSRPMAVFDRL